MSVSVRWPTGVVTCSHTVRERNGPREASGVATASSGPPHLARDYVSIALPTDFSVECPWQESNPWGSGLRVICVTIEQSYNRGCTIARWLRRSLLTRNPTGSIPARDTLRKNRSVKRSIRSPWLGVVDHCSLWQLHSPLSGRCVRARCDCM